MPAVVHVNRRLTDVSMHYPWEYESIGDWFFPDKPVPFLSDQFTTVNKANLLSIQDATPLGDDDLPPEVKLVYDADTTYTCSVYGLSSPGKWITARNADPALDFDTERVIQLTLSLRNRLEYLKVKQRLRSATYMTNTGTCAALQGSGAKFDSTSAANQPVKNLQGLVVRLADANGGRKINRMAMASQVLMAITQTDDFRSRVQYTVIPTGQVGADAQRVPNGPAMLLESMIGVAPGTIRVADHVYNAAASNQTASYKKYIGSDIVMGYVESLGLRSFSMSAGFQWSAYPGAPTSVISVPQTQRGTVPTEEYRVFTVIDPKVILPELGYLLTACVDTTNTALYGSTLD